MTAAVGGGQPNGTVQALNTGVVCSSLLGLHGMFKVADAA
jgi:hypothetical protein